ncbi:RagB/SusD family nutrient uptake outer membrane protein [Reichenbachiella sp. MALMAid0571]|uniref:RagB/SusD family nutrient uptake outer membrane protein n=1 Tax=Reichenbachiella sp. MALMAid0571 TaxID=3143939 RepID=UPI0032DE7DD9
MKINRFLIILMFTVAFSSCELTENPLYSLNEVTVFSDETNAQLAMNGIYVQLGGQPFAGMWLMETSEMGSGLGYANISAWRADLVMLNVSPATLLPARMWDAGYRTIRDANAFINAVEASELSTEVKDRFIGEAKFIRGFVYLQLTGFWGGLPLRTEPVNTETTNVKRSTRSEVYDLIEEDLLDAIERLEQNDNHGKVNEWAARALLAKTYFLRASQEDEINGTSSSYWQKAKEQGEIVISQGPYVLDPSLVNLWDANTTSAEVIFKVNFAQGALYNFNPASTEPAGASVAGSNNGRCRASKTAYDIHADKYPGDPRLDATFFHTSYERVSNGTTPNLYPVNKANNTFGWPYFKKHFDPDRVANESSKDQVLFRYADLVLLMAEVESELGNSGLAQTYVNQVLQRARTTDGASATEPADWPILNKEDFRKEIYMERVIELMGEAKTYVELRRRGAAWLGEVLQRHNDNPNLDIGRHATWTDVTYDDLSQSFLEKNLLLPLPSTEINFNDLMTQSDQNPGY